MTKRKPKLNDEDPVDTLDTEATESRKAAMAKLTRARTKNAVPEQQDQAPPGVKKIQVKVERC
jgi:hypothetical protein